MVMAIVSIPQQYGNVVVSRRKKKNRKKRGCWIKRLSVAAG